jgi:hypothetical protein
VEDALVEEEVGDMIDRDEDEDAFDPLLARRIWIFASCSFLGCAEPGVALRDVFRLLGGMGLAAREVSILRWDEFMVRK